MTSILWIIRGNLDLMPQNKVKLAAERATWYVNECGKPRGVALCLAAEDFNVSVAEISAEWRSRKKKKLPGTASKSPCCDRAGKHLGHRDQGWHQYVCPCGHYYVIKK